MDYSTSINDADNPAAASPWDSSPVSSPRHVRTSSYGASGEPPSPIHYGTSQSANGSYSQDEGTGEHNYSRPDSSIGSVVENEGHRPDTAESAQSQPEQQSIPSQQAPLLQHQQQQQQQHRQEPQRYHASAARQAQAQHTQGPQYKLQAKITGLERTGRKDPILRFDVHVSCYSLIQRW